MAGIIGRHRVVDGEYSKRGSNRFQHTDTVGAEIDFDARVDAMLIAN